MVVRPSPGKRTFVISARNIREAKKLARLLVSKDRVVTRVKFKEEAIPGINAYTVTTKLRRR